MGFDTVFEAMGFKVGDGGDIGESTFPVDYRFGLQYLANHDALDLIERPEIKKAS